MGILFLDLEATDLEPDKAHSQILEVAVLAVSDDLVTCVGACYQAHFDSQGTSDIDPVVRAMHKDNGLWAACLGQPSAQTELEVESRLIEHVEAHFPNWRVEPPQFGGNTIDFDRKWLRARMPRLHAMVHYRNFDVTTLNEFARRFVPDVYAKRPAQKKLHRALPDVLESLATARYYRDTLSSRGQRPA